MAHCINIKHPEYLKLLKETKLHPLALKAKISVWQTENTMDKFPTKEQLLEGDVLLAKVVKPIGFDTLYQNNTSQSDEDYIASEKTIRDLAAKMSDRIGLNVKYESDRTLDYKGKLEGNTAIINLAYATLDTPIHEILGHPIIRGIKGKYKLTTEDTDYSKGYPQLGKIKQSYSRLYNNLLKELETGKGNEVLDRVKKEYINKNAYRDTTNEINRQLNIKADKLGLSKEEEGPFGDDYKSIDTGTELKLDGKIYVYDFKQALLKWREIINEKYTLEEQQEEALVELLGLMTADKLDAVKDGKLISLLKRLLKEMKAFMRFLLNQKEVEIDKLPDDMTLGDIANLLAYSNSKLILPGNEVRYTTPDNQTFKTYQEANNHISKLFRNIEDIDLNKVSLLQEKPKYKIGDYFGQYEKNFKVLEGSTKIELQEEADYLNSQEYKNKEPNAIKQFIKKNKEYEQSKEIIDEWKKVNNIQYNPEEVYSRGQGFYSVVGAYSDFDVELMFQNLLTHIEDNKKAGGEFTISAFTKDIDRKLQHLEGGGGKIRFKIFPKSEDIKWAAGTDVYSGSVWDASEKVSKDKKSELLGVSYTKTPSLNTVNEVEPNLANIIDKIHHSHNELGIELIGNNFRLEYDEDIPYTTKKLINSINSILDNKYGELVEPKINTQSKFTKKYEVIDWTSADDAGVKTWIFDTKVEAIEFKHGESEYEIKEITFKKGIQPTQTKENLKESIKNIENRLDLGKLPGKPDFKDVTISKEEYESNIKERTEEVDRSYYKNITPYKEHATEEGVLYRYFNEKGTPYFRNVEQNSYKKRVEIKEKEYLSQALINIKIAALKEANKKYPRSLIRSEIIPIQISDSELSEMNAELFEPDELPFQKITKPIIITDQQVQQTKDVYYAKRLEDSYKPTKVTSREVIEEEPSLKKNKAQTEVNKKLNIFLERIGVEVKSVDKIYNSQGELIDAVAKADIINKMIEVNEDKRSINTLPEEAAHFFLPLLGENHPLYKAMMNKIENFEIYKEVLEEYKEEYGDNIDKYKKEAIGKLISIAILNGLPLENETKSKQNLFQRWFDLAWKYLSKMFSKVKSDDMSPFIQSAKDILAGKTSELMDLDTIISEAEETGEDLVFYELSENDLYDKEELIKSLDNSQVSRTNLGEYETLDKIKVKDTVDNIVRQFQIKKNRGRSEIKEKGEITANKSVYIHKLNKIIMDKFASGNSIDDIRAIKDDIIKNSVRKLIYIPEFKELATNNPNFFHLSDNQFIELLKGVKTIHNQILKNNTQINNDLQNKTHVNPKIYTELSIYDDMRDLAETVDVLVIYPNGAAGIYKYEASTMKRVGREEFKFAPIPDYQIKEQDVRMGQIKRILEDKYRVKNFSETRVVPINLILNREEQKIRGFHDIQFGDKNDISKAYLSQIPVGNELTSDKKLNNSLNKLLNMRDNIRVRLSKDHTNARLKIKFEKINNAIKKIQMDRDISYVYYEIRHLISEFDRRKNIPKGEEGYLDLPDVVDFGEYLEVYKDFINDSIDEYRTQHKEQGKNIASLNAFESTSLKMQELGGKIIEAIIEKINTGDNIDITQDIVQTAGLGKLFKQLKDFDSPAFKKLAKLVTDNYEQKRKLINELIKVVDEKEIALGKWADSKGLDTLDAFRKILTEDKNLIGKFEQSYIDDFNNARENKKLSWLKNKDNTVFDTVKFERDRKKYFKQLDSTYSETILNQNRERLREEINKEEKNVGYIEELKDKISSLEVQEDIKRSLKREFNQRFDINENESAYYNKDNVYLQLQDNLKRYNEQWKFLIKKENKPLKDYYDMYINYNEQFDDLANKRINKNFVQETRQDIIDRFKQVGAGGLKDLKFNLMHSLETREYDISEREFDTSTNKVRNVIPLRGMDKLRQKLASKEKETIKDELKKEGLVEDSNQFIREYNKRELAKEYEKGVDFKSIDLSRSLILFAENVYVNQAMTDTEDTVRAIQHVMRSGNIKTQLTSNTGSKFMNKFTGKVMKMFGIPESEIETFNKFVDMYWYGLNTQNQDLTYTGKDGKEYSGDKLTKLVMKVTSIKGMALKPVLAIGNILGAYSNMYMMGAEGLKFTNKQLNKAIKLGVSGDKIVYAANEFFEPSARNLTYEKANKRSATWLTKWFTMDNMFFMHKNPDDIMDRNILTAIMLNHGIENGKIRRLDKIEDKNAKNLHELAYIKDNKFIIEGLTSNEFTMFRGKVRSTATKIKGSISEDNKNLIGTYTLGMAMMQFRNWIPGLASTRFAKLTYDETYKELEVGRYRVFAGQFIQASNAMEILKEAKTLAMEIVLSLPGINLLGKNGSLYSKSVKKNSKAAKFYYDRFLAENRHISKKDFTFEDFIDFRIAKLKGVTREISILLTFLAMTALIKMAIPDDDEEDEYERLLARFIYNSANRGLLEVAFWTDPNSTSAILQSPIPSFRTITQLYNVLANTVDVTGDIIGLGSDDKRAIFSKTAKDRTPLFYRSSKFIPGINSAIGLWDIFDEPLR